MTLSLAAVFIPLMFMGGIIGQLFKEFAITIAVAILVSGLVSLTLTPMLCSRLLKPHGAEQHGRLFIATAEAAQGTSYPEMLRLEQIAARRLERDPDIASFTVNVGGGMGSSNQAQ